MGDEAQKIYNLFFKNLFFAKVLIREEFTDVLDSLSRASVAKLITICTKIESFHMRSLWKLVVNDCTNWSGILPHGLPSLQFLDANDIIYESCQIARLQNCITTGPVLPLRFAVFPINADFMIITVKFYIPRFPRFYANLELSIIKIIVLNLQFCYFLSEEKFRADRH